MNTKPAALTNSDMVPLTAAHQFAFRDPLLKKAAVISKTVGLVQMQTPMRFVLVFSRPSLTKTKS